MKIWVEKDAHEYYLTLIDNDWDEPIEVTDDWWSKYLQVQREYYEMQREAAVKAGYEA